MIICNFVIMSITTVAYSNIQIVLCGFVKLSRKLDLFVQQVIFLNVTSLLSYITYQMFLYYCFYILP